MATVEAAKKRRLTQEDCDTVKYLLNYGRTLKEIGEIIRVDPSTVGKIRLADYNLEKYLAQRKAMNRKTKENKRAALQKRAEYMLKDCRGKIENLPGAPGEEEQAASHYMSVEMYRACKQMKKDLEDMQTPEVPGQMKMDLDAPAEEPEKKEPDDQTKLMKFQAAMMDKLLKKLDELIDVLKGGERNE